VDKENVVCRHNGVLFSHKEERNPAVCSKMGGNEGIMFSKISHT
jgi:hypothetical protein